MKKVLWEIVPWNVRPRWWMGEAVAFFDRRASLRVIMPFNLFVRGGYRLILWTAYPTMQPHHHESFMQGYAAGFNDAADMLTEDEP